VTVISFDLKCARDHAFEGWFADSAAYAAQVEAGEVTCPLCGDREITKALMAPNFRAGRAPRLAPPEATAPTPDGATETVVATTPGSSETASLMHKLTELRDEVEKNCDYVGNQFAEEARKIHYGETEQHNIYGETTAKDAHELREEGIEFGVLPWPKSKHS
jgi:hypothetical protein